MKVDIVCVEAFKVAEVIYAFRVVKVNVVVVVGIVVVVVIVEVGVLVVVVVVVGVEQFTESCNPALTSLIRNTRMIASFKGFLS